jgi:small subunit ribosomal protein S8
MSMTDPLADMLTRIRNGIMAKFTKVDVPASGMKISLAKIMKEEGYIKNYKVIKDRRQGILRLFLRYDENQKSIISGLERVSKPSRRMYVGCNDIPKVQNGLGISIVSTSKGVITDREARKTGVGGEVICRVW